MTAQQIAAKPATAILHHHTAAVCGANCPLPSANPQHAGMSTQITDFFSGLFSTRYWPARWYCGSWSDFHGWLYIVSDLLIWASYFAIPLLLARMITRRKDVPFPKLIWLFVAFIVLCGTTHLLDAIIFWWPAYRLSALVRFFTAIVSVFTLLALYKVMPRIMSLRSVEELEHEIRERLLVEAELNKSHEMLSRSHQQLKTFTHILSHNIRNHASNISLLASLVDPATLNEENVEIFDKISRVSIGLNDTLNDLADAIKIRENKIASEILELREITALVTDILESEILMNGVQIKYDFEVPTLLYPKLYLESIIMNLISNAIKYKKETEAPRITLKTYHNQNGNTVLECQDNGLGIDLKLHGDKVFGLYKTFHANKEAHGVGLFLVKTQVESQGGNIFVESEPNKGTNFKIVFSTGAILH